MGVGQTLPVQLIKITNSKDADGRNQEGEETIIDTWAEIKDPTGFRAYQNGQTQLGKTKDFFIRFQFAKNINCNWKIKYKNQYWTVSQILQVDEKRFYWRFTATTKGDV